MITKQLRLLLFVLLIIGILILDHIYGVSRLLAEPEQLPLMQAALAENRALALLVYMALTMVGCVVLALPGLVFAIAAGLLFGPFYGTLACSFATTMGAALAFLAGRYFLKDTVKPWAMKNRHLRSLLFEQAGRRDIFVLMITRLVPIFPYNLQNFAYGVTDIGFWPYTAYSFLFMLPGTAVYTIAASGFANTEKRAACLCIAGILLIVTLGAALMLHKRLQRAEARI